MRPKPCCNIETVEQLGEEILLHIFPQSPLRVLSCQVGQCLDFRQAQSILASRLMHEAIIDPGQVAL